MLRLGIPPEKLLMGSAFYGGSWRRVSNYPEESPDAKNADGGSEKA